MRFFIITALTGFGLSVSAYTPLPEKVNRSTYDKLGWDENFDKHQFKSLKRFDKSFRVLWWNTACGYTQADIAQKKPNKIGLYQNLKAISSWKSAPHIIILGEYCSGRFPKNIYTSIKAKYPNEYYLVKSNPTFKAKNGLKVFSKYPIDLIKKKMLGTKRIQKLDKRHRPYILLRTSWKGKDIFINPVHIINPWRKVLNSGVAGFAKLYGKNNDNYRQAKLFYAQLEVDVDFSKEKLLVTGDLNSAKRLFLKGMATYGLYASGLKSIGDGKTSFPSKSSQDFGNNFPPTAIDHSFVSDAINSAKALTLPLAGSDHYPVFTFID